MASFDFTTNAGQIAEQVEDAFRRIRRLQQEALGTNGITPEQQAASDLIKNLERAQTRGMRGGDALRYAGDVARQNMNARLDELRQNQINARGITDNQERGDTLREIQSDVNDVRSTNRYLQELIHEIRRASDREVVENRKGVEEQIRSEREGRLQDPLQRTAAQLGADRLANARIGRSVSGRREDENSPLGRLGTAAGVQYLVGQAVNRSIDSYFQTQQDYLGSRSSYEAASRRVGTQGVIMGGVSQGIGGALMMTGNPYAMLAGMIVQGLGSIIQGRASLQSQNMQQMLGESQPYLRALSGLYQVSDVRDRQLKDFSGLTGYGAALGMDSVEYANFLTNQIQSTGLHINRKADVGYQHGLSRGSGTQTPTTPLGNQLNQARFATNDATRDVLNYDHNVQLSKELYEQHELNEVWRNAQRGGRDDFDKETLDNMNRLGRYAALSRQKRTEDEEVEYLRLRSRLGFRRTNIADQSGDDPFAKVTADDIFEMGSFSNLQGRLKPEEESHLRMAVLMKARGIDQGTINRLGALSRAGRQDNAMFSNSDLAGEIYATFGRDPSTDVFGEARSEQAVPILQEIASLMEEQVQYSGRLDMDLAHRMADVMRNNPTMNAQQAAVLMNQQRQVVGGIMGMGEVGQMMAYRVLMDMGRGESMADMAMGMLEMKSGTNPEMMFRLASQFREMGGEDVARTHMAEWTGIYDKDRLDKVMQITSSGYSQASADELKKVWEQTAKAGPASVSQQDKEAAVIAVQRLTAAVSVFEDVALSFQQKMSVASKLLDTSKDAIQKFTEGTSGSTSLLDATTRRNMNIYNAMWMKFDPTTNRTLGGPK